MKFREVLVEILAVMKMSNALRRQQ